MHRKASMLLTARYSVLQGLYWGSYATVVAYASVFLLAHGFLNGQIGLLVAGCNMGAVILQPLLASAVEKGLRIGLQGLTLLLVGITGLSSLGLFLASDSFWAISLLFFISVTSLQTMQPFINALGFALNTPQAAANFGVSRSAGSFLYAIIASSLGGIIAAHGVQFIVLGHVFISLLLFVACFFFRASPTIRLAGSSKGTAVQSSSLAEFSKSNKQFLFLLAGVFLTFTCYNTAGTYFAQLMLALGGTSASYGAAISMGALLELAPMILFTKLAKRFKATSMIKFSSIFMVLRVFCFFLAKAPSALFATQLIHPFGYAVFILSSIYYVDHILPGPDKIKGHAFMTATTTGGAISGSLLGGFFIDRFNISTMLAIGCCIGIVGIAVVFLSFYLPLKNKPLETTG